MPDFLLAAFACVLGSVAIGFIRALRGPDSADRMMAVQLLGTGGIAALLLLSAATHASALVDVGLVLALLAPFATVAFVIGCAHADPGRPQAAGRK